MLKLLKKWKVLLYLFILIASLIFILPSTQKNIIIKSVSSDSPLFEKINPGDVLNSINDEKIEKPEDVYKFDNYQGILRIIHNNKLDLVEINNQTLGLVVYQTPSSKINFGMDLVGGTRVLLMPKINATLGEIEQTIGTLQTRINIYGLKEANFQQIKDISGNPYIQIEMATGSRQEIDDLLAKQGKFEAFIQKTILLENETYLQNKKIIFESEKIKINNQTLDINSTIILNNIEFKLINYSSASVVFFAKVFTGSDIESVCLQEEPGICVSRLIQQQNGWQFMFQIFISQEGANKFAEITRDSQIEVNPNIGEKYLQDKLILALDEKIIDELNIAADLAGKAVTTPQITGFQANKEDAKEAKLKLQSILQSGALPIQLKVIKIDEISPTLGKEFLSSAGLAGIVATMMVGTILFIKYRKIKIALPVIINSLSEVVMVLGIAAMIHWTIDLPAIAGIIAAIGTGVDSQIMIIDETLLKEKERIYSMKQKIKRAFFIVFGAAGTTIAAMIPLMIIGIGAMRGFAITTTLGILIGIFITRPAFAVILEHLFEKEELEG